MTYLSDLLATNPYLCWPLDDFGAVMRDASGNGRTGALQGTGYSQGNPPIVGGSPGYSMGWTSPGNIVAMVKSGGGIYTPTPSGGLEAVVNVSQAASADGTGNTVVCGQNDGAGHNALLWLIPTNGQPQLQLLLNDGSTTVTVNGPVFSVGTPHLVTGAWDGFNAYVYLDGILAGQQPCTINPGANDTFDAMGVDAGGFGQRNHYFGYSQYVAYWRIYPGLPGIQARGAAVAAAAQRLTVGDLAAQTDLLNKIYAAVHRVFPTT